MDSGKTHNGAPPGTEPDELRSFSIEPPPSRWACTRHGLVEASADRRCPTCGQELLDVAKEDDALVFRAHHSMRRQRWIAAAVTLGYVAGMIAYYAAPYLTANDDPFSPLHGRRRSAGSYPAGILAFLVVTGAILFVYMRRTSAVRAALGKLTDLGSQEVRREDARHLELLLRMFTGMPVLLLGVFVLFQAVVAGGGAWLALLPGMRGVDDENVAPPGPEPAERHPEQPVGRPDFRARDGPLVDRGLLTQGGDLGQQVPMRAESGNGSLEDGAGQVRHDATADEGQGRPER